MNWYVIGSLVFLKGLMATVVYWLAQNIFGLSKFESICAVMLVMAVLLEIALVADSIRRELAYKRLHGHYYNMGKGAQ